MYVVFITCSNIRVAGGLCFEKNKTLRCFIQNLLLIKAVYYEILVLTSQMH